MYKLMMIEKRKTNFKRIIISGLITSLVITSLLLLIKFDNNIPLNATEFYDLIMLMSQYMFFLGGSIMFAKVVVNEFEKDTVKILFTYPVNRTSIVLSKILYAYLIILLMFIVSTIYNMFLFYGIGLTTTEMFSFNIFVDHYLNALIGFGEFMLMHIVTLSMALMFRSTVVMIVSSFLAMIVYTLFTRLPAYKMPYMILVAIGLIGLSSILYSLNKSDIK